MLAVGPDTVVVGSAPIGPSSATSLSSDSSGGRTVRSSVNAVMVCSSSNTHDTPNRKHRKGLDTRVRVLASLREQPPTQLAA